MVNLSIDKQLKEMLPQLCLGCISGIVKVGRNEKTLWREIDDYSMGIQTQNSDIAITEFPEIKAIRDAYKALGKDPARYRGSAEALLRRIASGKGLYKVNTIVDINNLISLRSKHSVGTYDLDRLQQPLVLRYGFPGENYKGIGKEQVNIAQLPVFADDRGPYGSPTSDSERAMITLETTRILMVVISFVGPNNFDSALANAASLLTRFAQAENIKTWIVE